MSSPSPIDFLPLKPEIFHILLTLEEHRLLHGWAIIKEVEEATSGAVMLEPSPLYRRLKRLLEDGLIEDSGVRAPEDERRVYYRLTSLGRRVLKAESTRLVSLASSETVRRLARS